MTDILRRLWRVLAGLWNYLRRKAASSRLLDIDREYQVAAAEWDSAFGGE